MTTRPAGNVPYFAACREHVIAILPELAGEGAPQEGTMYAAPVPMNPR